MLFFAIQLDEDKIKREHIIYEEEDLLEDD